MKRSKRLFAVVSLVFAVLLPLSIGTLNARAADINNCRARYRDSRRLNKLPSFECRGVCQDCTRYTCTGLGPG
jgi:hypothetical protein